MWTGFFSYTPTAMNPLRRSLTSARTLLSDLRGVPLLHAQMEVLIHNEHSRTARAMAAVGTLLERSAPRGDTLADHEFSIYSQWGEDGIISHLVNTLAPEHSTFIEFGVESYVEANTRWLLEYRNWRGLVIDGSESHIRSIRDSALSWRHSLTAVQSFVNRDNIDSLISTNGFAGPLGILSIDIDGVDYWVWERITCVDPLIVIVEYNSLFGPDRCVTVPYREDFIRHSAHHSCIYYGASLAALVALGERKGYAFVGSNTAGNNAFFVKRTHLVPPLRALTAREGYVKKSFREARNPDGTLAFMTFEEEARIALAQPLVDVSSISAAGT